MCKSIDIFEVDEKLTLSQPKRKRYDSLVKMDKRRLRLNNDVVGSVIQQTKTPLRERATRKTVSFGAGVEVQEVMSRHEYTSDERTSCWFDADDFRRRKHLSSVEARLLEFGRFHTIDNDTTVRGLEGRTKLGANRKRQHRFNVYLAVFDEIDFQYEMGSVDVIAIASSYAIASAPCAVYAQLLAQFDEIEARIIYNDSQPS
jgi:hypothetical protein